MKTPGQLVKQLRHERRWNQYQLANAAGVSQSLIAKIELDLLPISAKIERALSVAFGIPYDEFHHYLMNTQIDIAEASR
ncbi:helix-turn-helix domain-containing protein [Meiothermus ruber]|uniref:helix-turn-helix domain-containing protein n=1 Tax=Meiothermus ruber TaxID=277 RepID=UPI000561E0B1